MRSRLLQSTIAAVAVAVLLLGLPLAIAVRTLLTQRALDELQREVDLTATILNQPALSVLDRATLLEDIARQAGAALLLVQQFEGGLRVQITADAGVTVPPELDADLRAAVAGREGRVRDAGLLAVSVPVRIGGVNQILRAVRPDDALRVQIRRSLVGVAGLAVAALAAAALVAWRQGRRFAAPLEDLAASARRLGDGDFSARAPRSGLPEPDQVAAALDVTAARLGAMTERSRSFSADASHQLRTPLTALRLDLEALAAVGADVELLDAALAEADRLGETIAELSALAAVPAGEDVVDLGVLAAGRLDAWRTLAGAQGRAVVMDAQPVPLVRARAAAVGQALQVLLDNALTHGGGTISVSVRAVAGGARLCVADEGPGLPDDVAVPAAGSGGRGLPLARALVEAEGGRLRLERARPGAMLCLVLPAAPGADHA